MTLQCSSVYVVGILAIFRENGIVIFALCSEFVQFLIVIAFIAFKKNNLKNFIELYEEEWTAHI